MSGRKQVRVQGLGVATAIGLALLALPASAATEVVAPTDPVEKAAFDVLDKHCARCHQDGKLTSRERPAKNFGNVLKLDEIASNPNYVLPGNPFGSKLFKQITDKEMPYDVAYEGDTRYENVSEAELKALETWIQQLGTKSAAACGERKFVSHEDVIGVIASDLDKLPRARKKGTRYLTLTHLKNACTSDEAMKVFRQGAIKLVNSLSRSSDVVRLETVDPEETIIRINIDDLGWEASDWDTVLATYPYNMQPETELTSVLKSASGTQMPYVRADWFAFAASQPPLYDKLLKLPKTFQALAKEQGVDVEGNIRKFIAQRSGFQKSGVSQNNRLIERHPSRSGYFWTSYDFAGNKGRQSLFESPLGPTGPNSFQHDGGETIYSLPNGFQAYYLNTEKGVQIDKGPTTIVRDLSRKDLAVTNGISCMGCHDQGMRKAKDEVRDVVLAGRSFPKDVRDKVEALYPPTEKMDQLIENDGKRFADAMFRAGLEPTLKLNGVEMINALAKRYEDDVDINLAAAEFGMTRDEFKDAADDAERRFKALIRRLEQGSVPRDQFETTYRELAKSITDEEEVRVAGSAAGAAKVTAAKPAAGIGAELSLISDRDTYRVGDTPVFTVVSNKDCFLTLSNLDEKGTLTVLLPNKFQQNNRVRAGQEVQFPGSRAPFQYRMADKGLETVIATCSEGSDVDGIKHDFAKSNLTTVQNYTRSLARAIAVEGKPLAVDKAKSGGAPVSVQTAKAPPAKREVSRAAIKIEVQ